MSLRFLSTADIHVHAYKQFAHILPNGRNSRLENCLRVFDILKEQALKRKIDKILLLGDIFDSANYLDTEAYGDVYERLEEIHKEKIETVIVPGNHDYLFRSNKSVHTLKAFRKVATIIEEPSTIWKNEVRIIPFMENQEDIKKAIRYSYYSYQDQPVPELPSILAVHCAVSGAKPGATGYKAIADITVQDLMPKHFKLVILGDFHRHQYLDKNVFYLGSPLHQSFNEGHNPCIWDITLKNGKIRTVKIPTNLPKFLTIQVTSKVDLIRAFKKFPNDYLRLIVDPKSGLTSEAIDDLAIGRYKFRIERLAEQYETLSSKYIKSLSLSIEDYISTYVETVADGDKNLLNLGVKIYNGVL